MEAAIAVARLGLEADPPALPPRALVPLLGFKRFPDRALAAARKVVDDDEGFRRRVREATTEEHLGRASWLFLDRPEGWEEELAGLAVAVEEATGAAEETKAEASWRRREAASEASLERAREELARMRVELVEAKDQLAGERRGRRLAESDAGRLRRETMARANEVDELRRRQADLEQLLDQARQQPALAPEPVPDEPAPAAPVVDYAGLAELLGDGVRAMEALSVVLTEAEQMVTLTRAPPSPPTPESEPQGRTAGLDSAGRRRPAALPPGTFDDSIEAADHLVRIVEVRILVDGYNVTKSARPELSLSEQRQWLVDAGVELAARTGARIELVFDGADDRASAPADLGRRQGVQVRYTAEGVEADDAVLELIEEFPAMVPVVVASDDRRVRDGAHQRGANVVSTSQLLKVLNR